MRNKQARQTRIRELLFERVIDTHEKLAAVLHELKIEVSQSTLSKDLRELGVVCEFRRPTAVSATRYPILRRLCVTVIYSNANCRTI